MRFEFRRTRVALAVIMRTAEGIATLQDTDYSDTFDAPLVWTPLDATSEWAVPFHDDGWVCYDSERRPKRESVASCGEKPKVPLRRVLAGGVLDAQVRWLPVYRCGRDAALLAAIPDAMCNVSQLSCDLHGDACGH